MIIDRANHHWLLLWLLGDYPIDHYNAIYSIIIPLIVPLIMNTIITIDYYNIL